MSFHFLPVSWNLRQSWLLVYGCALCERFVIRTIPVPRTRTYTRPCIPSGWLGVPKPALACLPKSACSTATQDLWVELPFPTNLELAQFNWLKHQGWKCQADRDAGKKETRCWSVPSSGGGDLNLFASWRPDPPKLHFLQLKNCPTVSLLFAHLGDPPTIVRGTFLHYSYTNASWPAFASMD